MFLNASRGQHIQFGTRPFHKHIHSTTFTHRVTQQPPVFQHDHKNKISLLVCVNREALC